MITQADLRQVLETQDALKSAAEHAAVQFHAKLQTQLKAELDALRARVKADERVEAGKIRLIEKRTVRVAWERFWKRLREVPAVAKLLLESPDAQELHQAVVERDTASEYVSEALEISVVRS